ncbi:hypothetical protein QVD17_36063 [Tagetes erecta]|uniref:Rubisco LSMT substrate-binding domain-containing protein n=1 Tax=Tagetes erecta TaxID=13708 RepID=A0AAD8JRZ3_TARER|nr:hypothetical protein QVD17_36063 [Tagetes erecta]
MLRSSSPDQVIDHNVDDESSDLLTWLRRKSGAEISSVLSIGSSNYGRSLFACKPIKAGDVILKVPFRAVLAADNLDPSIHPLLGKNVHGITKLALTILQHQRLGQASEWAPYISCLPRIEDMHSTIFWSVEELQMIKMSSLYEETLRKKAYIEKYFSSIKHVLDRFPEYFEAESRSWTGPRGASMLIAAKDYAPGDEVLVRYGKLPNPSLLLIFGFVIPHNKYEQAIIEINTPKHDPLLALKMDLWDRHQIQSLLRSLELGITLEETSSGDEGGIPESLRAHARILCCTSRQELRYLAQEAAENDGSLARIPLKNRNKELKAHRLLRLRSIQMIENHHAALESMNHLSSGIDTRRMQIARDLLTGELRALESASAWLKNYCETLSVNASLFELQTKQLKSRVCTGATSIRYFFFLSFSCISFDFCISVCLYLLDLDI